MVRICAALAGLASLALAPFASAQAPAAPPANVPASESAESIIVEIPKVTERKALYNFFQDLDSNAICPRGRDTPRGHSCAELTYDVFDAGGSFIRRCNIPIFRLNEVVPFEYSVTTFEKFDCSPGKKQKLDVDQILFKDLLNPRTRDKTVFKPVSIIGFDQARSLCDADSKLCVNDLFDHTRQLSFKALGLWR